jgi:hypothetical protein
MEEDGFIKIPTPIMGEIRVKTRRRRYGSLQKV